MKLPDENLPPGVELEDLPCPMGCERRDRERFTGGDRLSQVPGRFRIVQCTVCGLQRTNPRPTIATIGHYYPDDYGPYVGTRVSAAPAGSSGLRSLVRGMLDQRSAALPHLPPGHLLEVGSASGAFLMEMQDRGWRVQGIEPSATAAQAARDHGLEIYNGPLEDTPAPANRFDLIVSWMAIEHLHDPVSGLSRLRDWLNPQGYLVLSVPNAGSMEARLFKNRWYALQLPAHLFHFTPETISKVLDASGFSVERVLHQRTLANLFGSVGHALADWGRAPRAAGAASRYPEHGGRLAQALHPIAVVLASLGQTGRMVIWARPRPHG